MSDENGRGDKSIFSVQSVSLLGDFGGLLLPVLLEHNQRGIAGHGGVRR